MGILGAVGGIVGAGINYLGQKSTNEANLKLAKMQNDWNEQMWERNNAYNAPSSQVQRLIEAGINPLGQNFTSYQSGPVESANLANQQAPQLDTGSIVQGFQGDRNLDIQEKLADAEVKLKKAEELATLAGIPGVKGDSKYKHEMGEHAKDLWDEEVSKKRNENNLLILQGKKVSSETTYQDLINEYLPYDKYYDYSEAASKISLNEETEKDIRLLRPYKQKLMTAQTNEANASADEHRAGAALKREQINLTKEQELQVKADVLRIMADKDLKTYEAKLAALDVKWRKKFGYPERVNGLYSSANYTGKVLRDKYDTYLKPLVKKIYDGVAEGLVKSRGEVPAGYSSNPYFIQGQSHSNPFFRR